MTDIAGGAGVMQGAPQNVREYRMYIGGEWVDARSGATFESTNPYSGEVWASAPDGAQADVDAAVAAARTAFNSGPWSEMTGAQRAARMRALAEILVRDAELLGEVETRDNGKLLREMSGQTAYLPEWYYYFASLADKLEGEAIPSDRPNFFAYTRHEPVGVVGAIIPWNSPLLLLTWKLAPGLAAGCTFVVKPSDYTPISALEFAKRFEEAGFPSGVFNVVTGYGPSVGKALTAHPGVSKVAFTGSTATGIDVGRTALGNLTRFSLELGGKSAQLVFEDADLDAAASGVIAGVFAATGQTCIAGSRLLVHDSVHDDLVQRIVERARTIKLGDPLLADTEMGPVANRAQFDRVVGFLDEAASAGATVACGGSQHPELGGLFVQPTVVTDVRPDMRIAREEIFGPVLSVMRFGTEDEAIAMANDSAYGLAGGVWTQNVHRAHRVAHRLEAGTVWINAYRIVAPNVPFGGVKMSGLGRESGIQAVREYTETKAIWVELSGQTRDPFTLG